MRIDPSVVAISADVQTSGDEATSSLMQAPPAMSADDTQLAFG